MEAHTMPMGEMPGPNDRAEALELLKNAGFTETQADVLATMYELLMAEISTRQTAEPRAVLHEPTPARGAWQHPGLADLLPAISEMLPDLLKLVMAKLRPPPAPPRPWWQKALRHLAGLDT